MDFSLEIGSLNANTTYYFAIDAYNENGIILGTELIELKNEIVTNVFLGQIVE